MLRQPWSWHRAKVYTVGTTSSPTALGRDIAHSEGFGLPKHLCTPRGKPDTAQPTAYNQESSQEAKPKPGRGILAWQCPETSYSWAEVMSVQVLALNTCVPTLGGPQQTSAPSQTTNTWFSCCSAQPSPKRLLREITGAWASHGTFP